MKLKDTRINFITAITNKRALIFLPPSVEETLEMIVRINKIIKEIISLFILEY